MTSTLQTDIAELNALKKTYRDHARSIWNRAFKQFFTEHQDIKAIVWLQYTPYFNDGDTCEFNIQEMYFANYVPNYEEDPDAWYGEPDAVDSTHELYTASGRGSHPDAAVKASTKLLAEFVNSNSEMAQEQIGDHAAVLVTEAGIEVFEYDHD